jgi:hypothetical protein
VHTKKGEIGTETETEREKQREKESFLWAEDNQKQQQNLFAN